MVMGSASGTKSSLVSFVEDWIQSFPDITAWKHKSEPQVKQLISFDEVKGDDEDSKASKKKMKFSLIDQLKKKGTHVQMAVLSKGKGELAVEKRPGEGSEKGLYRASSMRVLFRMVLQKGSSPPHKTLHLQNWGAIIQKRIEQNSKLCVHDVASRREDFRSFASNFSENETSFVANMPTMMIKQSIYQIS